MKKNIQTLKGFRDFLPQEKRARDFVAKKIKATFETFGFEPLETPTLEYADLLLGKYGAEADKLVYTFEDRGGRKVGLRYDQTVPTARVLAQYQNELPKIFRRYSIQNVFRADKPQQGRFREFTQCDIDIFGSQNDLADAEILACTYAVFKNLGFKNLELKINDRSGLITALEPYTNNQVNIFSLIQSIDKLDKLSQAEVAKELVSKGLKKSQAEKALVALAKIKPSENLKNIIKLAENLGVAKKTLVFSPALARGLDYYTGMIFEIICPEFTAGSLGGGGRYDNLIADLSGTDIPAVGVGLGFDRIVEAAKKLNLIPQLNKAQILVTIFDKNNLTASLELANKLRAKKIKTELYPQADKLGKQFKYANQKQIPFVAIIGEDEAKQNKVTLKNMTTSEQELLTLDEVILKLKN